MARLIRSGLGRMTAYWDGVAKNSRYTGPGYLTIAAAPIVLRGFAWNDLDGPAAVSEHVGTVGDVETVEVTLGGHSPPPGGKLFVRVQAQ
ncbi:MAG: hypothetical protein NTW21_37210 [Verrucomicrobia bacterium]|nr:hypothetical protein [Verrucomicrobiota bacterium]